MPKKKPEKSLTKPIKKTGGRANSGRISVRHKGGGVKRLYRIIGIDATPPFEAEVKSISYDPNRTCYIALVMLKDGKKAYILSPQGLQVGDTIKVAREAPVSPGNRMKLKNVSVGANIYNLEIEPGRGGKVARSAGNACKLLSHEEKYSMIKMPSGEVKYFLNECWVSIGESSNPSHRFKNIKKAGSARKKGIRPTVRGSAMAADAHPHGGGEGRAPIGLKYPKTVWGQPASGTKTRKKKWTDKLIVRKRKRKRKK